MLQRTCLVLSVCALAFFLGGGLSQAGWSVLGLTSAHDASSPIIFVKKHKHHDDDDNDNNDDNGLEQCTIVKSGGMGCVAPQKLVCQKMKNGQKCCGCVGDKSTKTQTQKTDVELACCHGIKDGQSTGDQCGEINSAKDNILHKQIPVPDSVTCGPYHQ